MITIPQIPKIPEIKLDLEYRNLTGMKPMKNNREGRGDLQRRKSENCIGYRYAEPELHAERGNWYKMLYQIQLEPFSPAKKIIEMYFKAKKKDDLELNDKIKTDILKYSMENLCRA